MGFKVHRGAGLGTLYMKEGKIDTRKIPISPARLLMSETEGSITDINDMAHVSGSQNYARFAAMQKLE